MNADPASVGLIQSIVDDSMDSGSESPSPQEIKGEPVECKVYPGRFYVLMVLSFVAIQQNVAWLTFGTIPDESYEHFRLSNVEIAILAAYGPIVFIPLTFPFMWFLQRFGLRVSVLTSAWILAVGCTIRIFVPDGRQWVVLFHIGHILIAVVGLVIMIAPPRLSTLWFPPGQRTFATALSALSQQVGVALGFVIVPFLTRQYSIHTMLYVQAEMGVFVALLATIYFPPSPPTPPSLSAGAERINFKSSLKALLHNRAFLILAVSGGIASGANFGFSSILSIILNSSSGFHDVVPVTSMNEFFHSNAWLGAASALAGVAGGQIAALFADRVQRRFKVILLLLLSVATAVAVWFSLSVYGYTSDNAVNVFLSLCFQYFFTLATIPIYYEAAVEATFPVPEGSSSGVVMMLSNVASLILQLVAICGVFSNKYPERARAMVWVFSGLTGLSGLLILFFKEDYKRLNIDSRQPITTQK